MIPITQEWADLLRLIPGYDPIATAPDGAWFDAAAAQRAIDFFPACLVHIEGDVAGKPFVLEPWEKSFVANLFGWKMRDLKGRVVRRYRETLLFVARKNGKTPLASGVGLLVFFMDKEPGQQDFIAASTRDQAGKLFRHAKGMVDRQPQLKRRCKIYGGTAPAGQSKSIVREEDNSFLRVISGDAQGEHGGNTHLAIIDELHEQPNRDLVDVLQTSFASEGRSQPLLILITTSDFDRPSICNEKHDYACKVRDGIIDDPRFLPVIYELTREDKWDDEANWHKANPNLGVSVSLDYLRAECKRAKEVPAYENTFRRLHLNQRTTTNEKCIPMDQWDACKRDVDLSELAGRECYGGLDIGSISDLTAFVLHFPHADAETVDVPLVQGEDSPADSESTTRTIMRRTYTMLAFFWLPERPVKRDARMMAQIDAWRRQGFIMTTPGDVVDYDQVLADILEIIAPYYLVGVNFDRGFQGVQIGTNLIAHLGEERVRYFSQGILSMAPPFREMLELLAAGRLHHDGNPVMRWMASNTVGERRGGLVKPSKEKSAEKIDGITGGCMGLAWAMSAPAVDWYVPGQGL